MCIEIGHQGECIRLAHIYVCMHVYLFIKQYICTRLLFSYVKVCVILCITVYLYICAYICIDLLYPCMCISYMDVQG